MVPAEEIARRLDEALGIEPLERAYRGEVAERWRYRDGSGELGIIASVTRPFCATCTRARLTTDGRLVTCLFASRGTDLRGPLRAGASDDELRALLEGVWLRRADRYSEIRSGATEPLRARAKQARDVRAWRLGAAGLTANDAPRLGRRAYASPNLRPRYSSSGSMALRRRISSVGASSSSSQALPRATPIPASISVMPT